MKKKLDIMSVSGLAIGLVLLVLGIVLFKNPMDEGGGYQILGSNLKIFFNLPGAVIVFGGTAAVLMLSFPLEQFARVPIHLKKIFMPQQFIPEEYIAELVEYAKRARISGLLALEEDVKSIKNAFMKNSLQLIVDSVDPEKLVAQMDMWSQSIDDRHYQERAFYDKGAQLAPALGLIGTLIGIINMFRNLSDLSTVGSNLAVALVATFNGAFLAYFVFSPISNKLRVRHDEEYLCMEIIYVGIQAIQSGENPNLIQEKLEHLLPAYRKKEISAKQG